MVVGRTGASAAGVVVGRTPQHLARVESVTYLTPRMRRVSLGVASLTAIPRPAQDIELILPDPTGRKVKRRYTIRNHRRGCFDVDVLLHGTGPGALWGASVVPGDTITFQGPRGRLELADCDWHLFLGDESSVPAIAELAAAARNPTIAVIEVGGAQDEQPVAGAVHWLHRDGTAPGTDRLLGPALETMTLPGGTGHTYLLGESLAMIALKQRARTPVYVKGYWNRGRVR